MSLPIGSQDCADHAECLGDDTWPVDVAGAGMQARPRCGETCPDCPHCLHCFPDDPCEATGQPHRWRITAADEARFLAEHPEATPV